MNQEIADLMFHDRPYKRDKWMKLFEDPIWKPIYNAPLSQHRDLAYNQLKKVALSGIVSVLNFVDDPTNIFTAHEMIGQVNGSTATKFTVHYNLFGGSIVALHTQRHRHIFEKLDRLQITGCFCLTELGYGNNAVKMQTTSTYDDKTQEFIINSPTTLSQKYWITNGSIHANQALVFAQTIVKGKNQGINTFLVPIRDSNLKAFNGVEINEMGYKIGMNGVDNAALKFHNVRIPRENMLNRYSDVDANGQFKSDIKGIQQRFFKVTERLLSGRLCIASMSLGGFRALIYVAFKYAKQRFGVSENGQSQTPIFNYQLQRNALVPVVSRMLALSMLHNFAKRTFASPKGHEHDLLMICCVDKTLVGWHMQRSVTLMRERCGGQGFLAANMFGEGLAAAHAALTAEGDNRVLMIKVVKDMLTIFQKNPDAFYNGEFIKVGKVEELHNMDTLLTLFDMRQKHLLMKLVERMMELKTKGLSNYQILMNNVSDEVQSLAQAYGENLALKECARVLKNLKHSQHVMKEHFILFAWQVILRQASTFILEEWITAATFKQIRLAYNEVIRSAAEKIDTIIDNLNIPVHAIYAPIAKDYVKYNEKSYQGEIVNAKM